MGSLVWRFSRLLRRLSASLDQQVEAFRSTDQPKVNVYLFVAINGAGLGHLTRCLAVASALKRKQPDAVVIFFTTSLATVIVHRFGFLCYHIPPFAQAQSQFVNAAKWNDMFADNLSRVVELYRPRVLMFDGTYAYQGLQETMRRHSWVSYVWMRRAGTAVAHEGVVASQEALFQAVLVPGDVAPVTVNGRAEVIPGVVLLEPSELMSREAARQLLGLRPDQKAVYLQLGAGNINELSSLEETVLTVLQKFPELQVVVSTSPIALSSFSGFSNVKRISEYPNARYFDAFDFAILAAGYNSVMEALAYRLPAVFIPNRDTKSDDQVKRAGDAAGLNGWALWDGEDATVLEALVAEFLERDGRSDVVSAGMANGSLVAAEKLIDLAAH